jgi:hypothetical protein
LPVSLNAGIFKFISKSLFFSYLFKKQKHFQSKNITEAALENLRLYVSSNFEKEIGKIKNKEK